MFPGTNRRPDPATEPRPRILSEQKDAVKENDYTQSCGYSGICLGKTLRIVMMRKIGKVDRLPDRGAPRQLCRPNSARTRAAAELNGPHLWECNRNLKRAFERQAIWPRSINSG
jgi:hypothetical protein